jgi:hypothetical protein
MREAAVHTTCSAALTQFDPQYYSLFSLITIKTVKPQLFDRFISIFNQDQEDLVQRLTNMDTENRGLERELSRLQVCTVVNMHHNAI